MEKMTLKKFLDWRLLAVIALFAVVDQLLDKVRLWYFSEYPIQYDFHSILSVSISFLNLTTIASMAFFIIRWLNTVMNWSNKNVLLRGIIEIIIFTILSNTLILAFNQTHLYFKVGTFFRMKDIVYLCISGTVINFFLIPIVELSIMYYSKHQTTINSKQLQIKNEQFKYELLKNQINPHFLFNSLSVLNSLISIDQNLAREFTNNFSNVLRHVLNYKFTDSISLKEEKVFLKEYIYLLKTRFADALDVEIQFSEKFINENILPMVLQLLIENVIKHNEVSDVHPMYILVLAQEKGIIVSNKVRLKSSIPSWGIGLDNIKERYASLGQAIEVKKEQDMFKVFIPYIIKK